MRLDPGADVAAMVDPAGMWPGAGSGPDGRRLATQARLASTALLPLSAAVPVARPEGDGTAPMEALTGAGRAAVPHAVARHAAVSNVSRPTAALSTLSPRIATPSGLSRSARVTKRTARERQQGFKTRYKRLTMATRAVLARPVLARPAPGTGTAALDFPR